MRSTVTSLLTRNLLVNAVPEALLSTETPIETVRHLFGHFVREVEIENHSFCNRICSFCPNAFIDRRSENHIMSDAVFDKIIGGLASVDFSGKLIWSRYAEVLAHPSVFPRMAAARKALPNASLEAISNGDYLTRDSLRELERAGLDVLGVDLYDDPEETRTREGNEAMMRKFEMRTGLTRGSGGSESHFVMEGSSVTVYCGLPNFAHEYAAEQAMSPADVAANSHRARPLGMSTRGGLIDVPRLRSYRRSSACVHTLVRPTIDYNGKGVYCCHVRSDSPAHASVTVGDLSQPGYTLFHLYRDMAPARAGLLAYGPKTGVCGSCNSAEESPWVSRRPWLAIGLTPVRPILLHAIKRRAR